MGKETGISWTNHTFNTHWGCDRKHGADMSEFALDLQVREFPQVRA